MPYEFRAKAGEGAFSVVVETAKQALEKVDELFELAHVEDVSVRMGLGKSWIWARSKLRRQRHRRGGRAVTVKARASWPSGSETSGVSESEWSQPVSRCRPQPTK
jgi:hypothetical protein